MTLTKLHGTNAKLLGIFIVLHFANHALLLGGRQLHLGFIENLRAFYRPWFIEYPLFALFAVQIIMGIVLIAKRGRPQGYWGWAQVVSGGYIAFFLMQHLVAVVVARLTYDFETTTYWAAAVVSRPPFVYYFFIYYVLGITAVFIHVAAAMRFANWPEPATGVQKVLPIVGLAFGFAVVSALSLGSADELPAEYRNYLNDYYTG